ncbi:unnamed protein product [Rotaria sp. Silwood2]|nr:unnamed protein product [Rotaria sp. Silwood2]CAF2922222.1 unnamed protein product [Rotaria sp. Silwood2]CAF3919685.1 unnamed protein product [Rotaria sp. Silwood2]CAF4150268.1 unnamed protein product [Rotaria sp. Silwood2]
MGCGVSYNTSGLTIELYNQTRENSIYLSGEDIHCVVQFNSFECDPELRLKGAFIELIGQVIYTTSSTYRDYNGNMRTTQTIHRIPFLCQHKNFYPDLTPDTPMTISDFRSSDLWLFKFTLPHELPPSLPPTGYSKSQVIYFVRVLLECDQWYHPNIRHSIPITIYPRRDVPYDSIRHPIESEYTNRKNMNLHVIIIENILFPGTPFPIQYDLHNPSYATVQSILVQLYQYRQMGSSGPTKSLVFEIKIPDIQEFCQEYYHGELQLIVPFRFLPPTSFHRFDADSRLMEFDPTSITYKLVFETQISGFFTDFSLKVPITIGIEENDRSSLPPSYESLMKQS